MVAPRSVPEPGDLRPAVAVAWHPGKRTGHPDQIARLAVRWAGLVPAGDPVVAARLATLLRRLAAVLRAEPFHPSAARGIGEELLGTGICGDPADPGPGAEDGLPLSLGLLRREATAAFGTVSPEGRRRLTAALDEIAAGFARALNERGRSDRAGAIPPQALDGAERGVAVGDRHYRAVYDQGVVGMAIAALDGNMLDLNPAMCRMFGIDGSLDQPRPISDFVHPDDLADVIERYRRLVRGEPDAMRMEMRLVRPDAEVLWAHVVASLVRHDDGTPSHLMAIVEDLSERHRLRSRLEHSATKDQLGRLPSQGLTDHWLRRAFADGGPTRVGACSIDLDGFHAVNDALGDDVGDRLLLGVVGRLQLAAGDHLVARSGGDEFVVLVAEPDDVGDVCRLADRLQAALATPFLLDCHSVAVTASIGVAEARTGQSSAAELVRAADTARSWAKALGAPAGWCSTRSATPRRPRGSRCSPGCAGRSTAASSGWPSSHSSASSTGGCSVPRRWCAGSTPSRA